MSDTEAQERRCLREALLDLCVEGGYPGLELNALLERAGLDEDAFHRYYEDLDGCFAGVLGEIYGEFFDRATEALRDERGWRDRMRATAYSLLRFLRADARVAHFAAVEAQHGGEGAQREFLQTFNRLVDLIDEGSAEAGGPDSPSRATAVGVGGVLFARLQEGAVNGEFDELGEAEVPRLMYAAVFPYLGAEAAEEELHIPPPPDL